VLFCDGYAFLFFFLFVIVVKKFSEKKKLGQLQRKSKNSGKLQNSYFYIKCAKRVFFVHEKVFYAETKVEAV
jgi:hypothetical protein